MRDFTDLNKSDIDTYSKVDDSVDDSEIDDSEIDDSEVDDSEIDDSEVDDSEIDEDDSEVDDSEMNDSKTDESKINDNEESKNEINIKIDECYNYVYLLHSGPFVKLNIPVYKIGRTNRLKKRFFEYPKDSTIYYVKRVINAYYVEDQIKENFRNNFTHIKRCGNEYFSGSLIKMIECIDNIIMSSDQLKIQEDIPEILHETYQNHLKIKL